MRVAILAVLIIVTACSGGSDSTVTTVPPTNPTEPGDPDPGPTPIVCDDIGSGTVLPEVPIHLFDWKTLDDQQEITDSTFWTRGRHLKDPRLSINLPEDNDVAVCIGDVNGNRIEVGSYDGGEYIIPLVYDDLVAAVDEPDSLFKIYEPWVPANPASTEPEDSFGWPHKPKYNEWADAELSVMALVSKEPWVIMFENQAGVVESQPYEVVLVAGRDFWDHTSSPARLILADEIHDDYKRGGESRVSFEDDEQHQKQRDIRFTPNGLLPIDIFHHADTDNGLWSRLKAPVNYYGSRLMQLHEGRTRNRIRFNDEVFDRGQVVWDGSEEGQGKITIRLPVTDYCSGPNGDEDENCQFSRPNVISHTMYAQDIYGIEVPRILGDEHEPHVMYSRLNGSEGGDYFGSYGGSYWALGNGGNDHFDGWHNQLFFSADGGEGQDTFDLFYVFEYGATWSDAEDDGLTPCVICTGELKKPSGLNATGITVSLDPTNGVEGQDHRNTDGFFVLSSAQGLPNNFERRFKNIENIFGSEYPDHITGDDGPNILKGVRYSPSGGGRADHHTYDDDTIRGLGGDDAIYGYRGWDNLDGGDGDDKVYGGDDDDIISGGAGYDYLDGGSGNDLIVFDDFDEVWGGAGRDYDWDSDQFHCSPIKNYDSPVLYLHEVPHIEDYEVRGERKDKHGETIQDQNGGNLILGDYIFLENCVVHAIDQDAAERSAPAVVIDHSNVETYVRAMNYLGNNYTYIEYNPNPDQPLWFPAIAVKTKGARIQPSQSISVFLTEPDTAPGSGAVYSLTPGFKFEYDGHE